MKKQQVGLAFGVLCHLHEMMTRNMTTKQEALF
jgi:hypothetical protein